MIGALPYMTTQLIPALADPVWSVRWNIAASMSQTSHAPTALAVLEATSPRSTGPLWCWLAAYQQMRPKTPTMLPYLREMKQRLEQDKHSTLPIKIDAQIKRLEEL